MQAASNSLNDNGPVKVCGDGVVVMSKQCYSRDSGGRLSELGQKLMA